MLEYAMQDRLSLVEAVMAAGRLNSRAAVLLHSQIAARIGLNASDTKALDLVMAEGPMSPTEIARATGLTTAATTTLLDRLEARGLVERSPDPEDRRRVRVSARKEAVLATVARLTPFLEELRASLDSYSDAELRAIARFMSETSELAMSHALAMREED